MAPISLSVAETDKRFGVKKEIKAFPEKLTEQEEKNVKTVLSYMEVGLVPRGRSWDPLEALPMVQV